MPGLDLSASTPIGTVSVVDFPLTDGQRWKRRPAVCVAYSPGSSALHSTIVMCAVTSSNRRLGDEYTVELRDWAEAGLDSPSWVQVDRLFSTQPVYFRGHLGAISDFDQSRVLGAVRTLLVRRDDK